MAYSSHFIYLFISEYLCNHTYATTPVGAPSPMSEATEASPFVHKVVVTSPHALTSPRDPETEQPPTTQSLPGLFFGLLLPSNSGQVLPSASTP